MTELKSNRSFEWPSAENRHGLIANVAEGSVFNNENLKRNFSFEASKARKLIYNLLRDMPTEKVYQDSNRNTLTFYYKLLLIKLLYSMFIGEAPATLLYLTNEPWTAYVRRSNNL